MNQDYKVKDINLAQWGRREITLAEQEMSGLMELRKMYGKAKPLSGAKIAGCVHMTVQTAVLIETLIELGAKVRWASCNVFSTQDHAAAALADKGISVFAWKDMSEEDFCWCIEQTIVAQDWQPNLLLDDGGDLTAMMHGKFSNMLKDVKGLSEQTTTGVHRLYKMAHDKDLIIPAININDSVTKSKFDNKYGCRESLVDSIRRATDLMLSGKIAVVCGFGDVGKGSAESLSNNGCRVLVTEIDPICALQASMSGYSVVTMNEAASIADIFVTATGNIHVINFEHMQKMKDKAVICNIGHFSDEIDVESIKKFEWINIKPQVDLVKISDNKSLILLAEGRLVNLGCATGHPSFVMSMSFTNQVLAQMELWQNSHNYDNQVYTLPKNLDEMVAKLHLNQLGVNLEVLNKEQAEYINVDLNGPFKSEQYRY